MGKSAPEPDAQMGEAALMSAQTGQDMLEYMRGQSDITNQWAQEGRERYNNVFQPLEDSYIADAQAELDPARIAEQADMRAGEAVADVRQNYALQRDADTRRTRSMGVRPDSGRDAALQTSRGNAEALAAAGAGNIARRRSVQESEARGDAMRTNVLNMGKGLSVNPATSMSLANGAAQAGFSGAQQGYGQQSNILSQQHQQQMNAWQADQGMMGSFASGLGSIVGALPMFSSKEYKKDKKPAPQSLSVVRKMPVEEWTYKEGIADGGTHIGPYAEDFAKATGMGDGKTIDPISMMGVTLGAVKELDKKVSAMSVKAAE